MNFEKMTISEINNFVEGFSEIEKIENDIIKKLSTDYRKGVKKIAQKIKRAKKKKEIQKENWHKQNGIIYQLQKKGFQMIAGIDEAGRGPLAGPVVSSAVVLDLNKPILGLTDSKKLSSKARERLFKTIFDKARVGIGIVSNTIIDRLNIHQATFLAMRRAVEDLQISPEFLLIDGSYTIPDIDYKQRAIVGGDLKVNAISAASIIAKVTRDCIMDELHSSYPSYNFLSNKGYGTQEHIEAIKDIGPCPLHRFSYKIVKENKEK
ncbi:MAG: ribonuclease HII [Halanaerobiales bacterium]|nr:ribonuclease HII [Halanaerobiales bacterium]